jgi:integrase
MTLPLFASSSVEGLKIPFERWLDDQIARGTLRQPSSIQVYRDMWGGFVAWALSQAVPITLKTLDARDLQSFQAARFGMKSSDLSLSPRHALRLLRLIDRVLRHHAVETGDPLNAAASDWIAAQPEVRFAEAAQSDPLPDFLTIAETKRLLTHLSNARPRPGSHAAGAAMTWQEVRNRTALSLQLGGGLTPADVRALTLRSPVSQGGRVKDRPWKVAVPTHGNWPARETPIATWSGELLQHWLAVRADARVQGEFLFPSTRTGKHYMCANRVLEDAGIENLEGGSFRLRHTFALRQLRRGTSPEQVAMWLGVEPDSMNQYSRVMEIGQEEI